MAGDRPVWGSDVPISMPQPAEEAIMVELAGGFAMTQYRLVHSITAAEYEELAVPVYAPQNPTGQVVRGDAALDAGQVDGG